MKLKRVLFYALYYGFARQLPTSAAPCGAFFKWTRYQICRQLFKECGENVNVEKGASFHSGQNIRIGNNSGIGINAEIGGEVTIGSDVMIGPHVTIWTTNHNFSRTDIPMNKQGIGEEKPVTIQDDVWIGSHVIILAGVTLGKGSVIGAGAVVTKSIPQYAVAVGNPARVVKYRNAVGCDAESQKNVI